MSEVEAAENILDIDSDIEEMGTVHNFQVDCGEELKDYGVPEDKTDAERLPRETAEYPPLFPPVEADPSEAREKVLAKKQEECEKQAAAAMIAGDIGKAVDKYTDAMQTGGATPVLLATRAALLLKTRRPLAAVRDCTAALQINIHIVKAYRLRGIAHRKLGNWQKAHRDLTHAQSLNHDEHTVDVIDLVARKLGLPTAADAAKKARAERKAAAAKRAAAAPTVFSSSSLDDMLLGLTPKTQTMTPLASKELDKGQAVTIEGLMNGRHLNGKRGVVQRPDPRPTAKGRWEVELRMEDGKLEVKSLKAENIQTLNKADKFACKLWMREERQHKEKRQKNEANAEQDQLRNCIDAKMKKMEIVEYAQSLLRKLEPTKALNLLDRAGENSGVINPNEFLITQAKNCGAGADSDDSDDDGGDNEYDPELMDDENEPLPPLPERPPSNPDQFAREAKARGEGDAAFERSDFQKAITKYTEAILTGCAAPLTIAKRGKALLSVRRPKAAYRDATASLAVDPNCALGFRTRGMVHRGRGHWEDAARDLGQAQRLEYDEKTKKVQDFVAQKVRALQERGKKRRPPSALAGVGAGFLSKKR